MAKTILIKRGTVANLPNLQEGEFGWATDTKELYVGDGAGAPVQVSYATVAALLAAYSLDASLTTLSLPDNTTISAFGKTLIDDADASAALTTLGIDADIATFALPANTTISAFAKTLLDDTSASAMRATIGAANVPGVTYIDDYAVGDGTTDDTAAIAAAITAATAGNILQFGPKTYKITDNVAINKALTIRGRGISSELKQVTTGKRGFVVTVSNVDIGDLLFTGVGHATYNAAEVAIDAYGASYATAISGIKVHDCFFANWGCGATQLTYVTDFSFSRNKVDGVHYYGLQTLSAVRGIVSQNNIKDVPGSGDTSNNAYGIALTRNAATSLVTDPRSSYITVTGNIVSNVPWEGIDTHGGSDITIGGNSIYACTVGISVTRATDDGNAEKYAPQNVTVYGNSIESGVSDGSMGHGIIVVGALTAGVQQYAYGCSVVGNSIVGHGGAGIKLGGGIYTYATTGIVISGNTVRQCARSGIVLDQKTREASITGNTIQDIFADSDTNVCGIYVSDGGDNANFIISDNTVAEHSSGATYKLTSTNGFAVLVENTAGNSGKLGLVGGVAGTDFTTLLGDAGSKVSKNLNT